jgi:fumarate hydratase class I
VPIPLHFPTTEERIRALRAGDAVAVSGRIVTAREAAHRRLVTLEEPRVRAALDGGLVYHCGPVVMNDAEGGWRFLAAGASLSAPVEPWQAEVIVRYGARAVLGKAGMGRGTRAALRAHGAVYLEPVRGLAVTLARCVRRVRAVHLLDELGVTDAIWEIEVEGLPAVVTMDAHGVSLHGADAEGAGLLYPPLTGAGA